MTKKTLHITNGDSLTDYLKELLIEGDIITWQEMLCEGPTIVNINSKEFFEIRKDFLSSYYNIDVDKYNFEKELDKLNRPENYSEIILWFEYDLFCHINLIGVISLLHQKGMNLPLYHVCSGRIAKEKGLKGLTELNENQLLNHYENKTLLTSEGKDLAISLWEIYCSKDHNLFKPFIVKNSSYEYLSNCLKAHLKRFPDSKSGLSALEANILLMVRDKDIKSKHYLLGYALNFQGYYGFGDLQFRRIIEKLSLFIEEEKDKISLNRKGHEALLFQQNFCSAINNNMVYGGVNRLDFQFSKSENKLIKTVIKVY